MPISRSAKKALRQSRTRRARNTAKRDAYKKAAANYRKLAAAKRMDEAHAALTAAYQALDKAAKTGVIKKNKADRLKSRLARSSKN
jgi:small subunit ribosomal protein S20